jgi:hypothetical protein
MRWFMLVALMFVLVGCSAEKAAEVEVAQTIGSGVTMTEVVTAEEILSNPEKYDGKKIMIEGVVVGVCGKGCKLFFANEAQDKFIKFRFSDDAKVFEQSLKGETLRAEGVFAYNAGVVEHCDTDDEGEEESEESASVCIATYDLSGQGAIVLKAEIE